MKTLEAESVQTVVTSPPYWGLRDYGVEGQLGAEDTVHQYIQNVVAVFEEVKRVLRKDGTVWLNIGDSYTKSGSAIREDKKLKARSMSYRMDIPEGMKPKDLIGVPWMLAFALRDSGWYLRTDIVWNKPNANPESVRDRPTRSHEFVFLLSKSQIYYYDVTATLEPTVDGKKTRRKRSVWNINTEPFSGAHFACFPTKLVEPCLLASTKVGDTVLDPFFGSGTVGQVALALGRRIAGIELSEEYANIAKQRLLQNNNYDLPLL